MVFSLSILHCFRDCFLNDLDHALVIFLIKGDHVLGSGIPQSRLGRLADGVQFHAFGVQRVQFTHHMGRRDIDGPGVGFVLDALQPGALPRRRAADKDTCAKQGWARSILFGVVGDERRCECGTLGEAHDDVKRTLFLNSTLDVLKGLGELDTRQSGVAHVVTVERPIYDALESCSWFRSACGS